LSTWIAAVYCKFKKTDVYFWTIGWHRPDRLFKRWIRRRFYGLAESLLLYGNVGRNLAIEAGIRPSRIFVVGNSSSTSPTVTLDVDQGILELIGRLETEQPYVIAVVRLNSVKRIDMLLDAVALLPDQQRPSVVLVGAGPELSSLTKQAQANNVRLYTLGAIHSENLIRRLYRNAFVSVIPEAAGLTVIQSLKEGVPVVTADDPYRQMPEYEAIEHGVNGHLYPAGDLRALAEAIDDARRRFAADAETVRASCRTSLSDMWTPEGQARRILEAIKSGNRTPS